MNQLLMSTLGIDINNLREIWLTNPEIFNNPEMVQKFNQFKQKMIIDIDQTNRFLNFEGITEKFKKDFDRNDLVFLLKAKERGAIAFTNNISMHIQHLSYPQVAYLLCGVKIMGNREFESLSELFDTVLSSPPSKRSSQISKHYKSPAKRPKRSAKGSFSAHKRRKARRSRNPLTPSFARSGNGLFPDMSRGNQEVRKLDFGRIQVKVR